MGLRAPELLILFIVCLLPFAFAVKAYRLAMNKGYGQLAAAAAVAATLVLAYFFPLLGLVPLIFFVLAPSKVADVTPINVPGPKPPVSNAQDNQPPAPDPTLIQQEVSSINAAEEEGDKEPEAVEAE